MCYTTFSFFLFSVTLPTPTYACQPSSVHRSARASRLSRRARRSASKRAIDLNHASAAPSATTANASAGPASSRRCGKARSTACLRSNVQSRNEGGLTTRALQKIRNRYAGFVLFVQRERLVEQLYHLWLNKGNQQMPSIFFSRHWNMYCDSSSPWQKTLRTY